MKEIIIKENYPLTLINSSNHTQRKKCDIIIKNNIISIIKLILFFLFILFIIILLLAYYIYKLNENKNQLNLNQNIINKKFITNFEYHNYQREMINEKMKNYSYWQLLYNEPYFINGIIRKFKPKKCLEIGVAYGGSAIIILNAIKDIDNSFLVSLDLNTNLYCDNSLKTGYRVKEYFPELANKWQLYTGEQPHKFLDRLNMKFDFLLLDTVHLSPGELINIIEVLPFLNENAIIILHDIMYHLPIYNYYTPREVKFHPSNIYLMSSLFGDKVIIEDKYRGLENIGAVILYPNQEKYYINYFLLLMSPWEYMPNDTHLNELRNFILKYYKNELFLNIFNKAVEENKIYINKFNSLYSQIFK